MARPSILAGLPRFQRGGFWLFVIAAATSALLADHPLATQLVLNARFAADLALWQPLSAIVLFPEGQLGGLVSTLLLQWFIGGHLEARWGTQRYLTFILLPALAGYLALGLLGLAVPSALTWPTGGTLPADLAAWRSDLEQRIQREWGNVAGQQIADLLGESIRINERMGITGVAAEPAPRFAVTDARGRKFIFTTSVASLRELGIIGWRDRVSRVTESGSVSLAQALWDYVATHGQINIVVPRSSPWYVAVRDPARSTFDPFQALKRWSALRAVQRAVRNTGPWRPPEAPASDPSIVVSRAGQSAQAEIDLHPTPLASPPPIPLPPRPPVSPTALTEEVTPISVDGADTPG